MLENAEFLLAEEVGQVWPRMLFRSILKSETKVSGWTLFNNVAYITRSLVLPSKMQLSTPSEDADLRQKS